MHSRRPGMTDVARVAGVSHQTVSRVLNGHPSVRPATRERVLAAIDELGYRRNLSARALVTRRSGLIGIVSSGSPRSGPAGTLGALEQAARAAGYFVTVAIASDPSADHREIADAFLEQGVEGVIVIAPTPAVADLAHALVGQIPVLVVASWDGPAELRTISVDQQAGAAMAAQHLLDLGHTDLVHVTGPQDWFDATARQTGWHQACAAAGVTPRPDIEGDWSSERGYQIGQELLADLPTAVFAANDLTALGILRAFAEKGIAVPRQVSVVGFDDLEGSANFYPPLTTVKQDFAALGTVALQALVDQLDGGTAQPVRLAPQLLIRASCAAAPG